MLLCVYKFARKLRVNLTRRHLVKKGIVGIDYYRTELQKLDFRGLGSIVVRCRNLAKA